MRQRSASLVHIILHPRVVRPLCGVATGDVPPTPVFRLRPSLHPPPPRPAALSALFPECSQHRLGLAVSGGDRSLESALVTLQSRAFTEGRQDATNGNIELPKGKYESIELPTGHQMTASNPQRVTTGIRLHSAVALNTSKPLRGGAKYCAEDVSLSIGWKRGYFYLFC